MSDASDTSASAAAAAWDPAADLAAPIEVTSGESAASVVYLCRFPGCGRQFPLKGNLKRHQNIHSGDKQFRCPHCDRSFLRKADMEVHLRVHTGEKPYACKHSGCDKRFARRSDLLSHERTHSGSKPFACEFPGCDRRFARRFDLHKHERSHDEEAGGAARASGAAKKPTMKRRLVATPRATRLVVTGHEDCEQCQMEMEQEREDDDDETTQDGDEESSTTATDDAAEPTKSRRPVATATAAAMRVAPISPTDHVHGPGKEFHFELTCTEDHIHTSPECFSMEELDALLGPSSAPAAGCCPEHLQSIAEAFATAHAHAHVHDSFHQSMGIVASYPHPHAGGRIPCYSSGGRDPHDDVPPSVSSFGPFPTHLVPTPLPPPSPPTTPARSPTDAMTAQLSSTSLNSPCPVVATAKLDDYAAHTACGHLAIQHGDHRDFVVKNHLVCVDSVKSLSGDCGGAHAGAKPHRAPPRRAATKCAPQDPHRPGCGHLAVRHGDHIDYVVEDNLFCQLAGGLMEDAGNLELLDDDFWEFYGAIGSLKTE